MEFEGGGASRGERDGFHNEDAYLVDEGLGLYVVCDGAGELPAGEVAARVAVDALEEFVERAGGALDLRGDRVARAIVARAMNFALHAICDAEDRDESISGMRTTMTVLLVHGRQGVIGHRGDSRAYLIRRNRVRQLTVDHELTETVESGNTLNDFEVFSIDLHAGDMIILCTDGAEQVMSDRWISDLGSEVSPRELANRIVEAAHRLNQNVDATAVVVQVRSENEFGWIALSVPTRGTAFGHTLAAA